MILNAEQRGCLLLAVLWTVITLWGALMLGGVIIVWRWVFA